jgi:hypothetical protein
VDERRRPLPHNDIDDRIGSNAAPVAVDARRAAEGDVSSGEIEPLPAEAPPEDSQIVFYGDEQRVREGFAIALRAMGLDADFLPVRIPLYQPKQGG